MTENCEPAIMQEIYAIKREVSARTQGMSPSEKRKYYHDITERFFAGSGLKPKYVQSAADAEGEKAMALS